MLQESLQWSRPRFNHRPIILCLYVMFAWKHTTNSSMHLGSHERPCDIAPKAIYTVQRVDTSRDKVDTRRDISPELY